MVDYLEVHVRFVTVNFLLPKQLRLSDRKIKAPYMVPAPLTERGLCAIIVRQIQETLRAQAIPAPDLYCPDLVSGSRTVCMVVKWRWLSGGG